MAGHSKAKNIKHRKNSQDQKRASIFSRISKEIISAVKIGGDNISANSRLRHAIENAKQNNMPKKNISKAIESGIKLVNSTN